MIRSFMCIKTAVFTVKSDCEHWSFHVGVSVIRSGYSRIIEWKCENGNLWIKRYGQKLSIEVWPETAEKRMRIRGFFSSFGRFCLGNIYPGRFLSGKIPWQQDRLRDAGIKIVV